MNGVSQREWATNYTDTVSGSNGLGPRGLLRHGVLSLAGRFARLDEPAFLRCLYLHYVYDDQVEAFRTILTRLQRLGRFISTDEAWQIASGRKPLDGRYFHLSIDDGFDNIHRNAFPVMQSLGIPALLFLPTALIGQPEEKQRESWWVGGVHRPTRLFDWDAAREMQQAGVEMGSHTRHHARLSDISGDRSRLDDEVRGSKLEMEDRLGVPCRFISWPYGTGRDIDDTSLAAIEAAGYDGCFSAVRGRVLTGKTSPFYIPRHHFEPQWPWYHVRYFACGGKEPD
jgi:peptidoglycan/xylan/chitin deacetylase (PgdA/CDA1 family)